MSKSMGSEEFLGLCKREIVKYYKEAYDYIEGATRTLTIDDVYVVWYSKSLQNHKALLSTTIPDGTYFELTYNGDKHELYFDAYKKWKNMCIKVPEDCVQNWTINSTVPDTSEFDRLTEEIRNTPINS